VRAAVGVDRACAVVDSGRARVDRVDRVLLVGEGDAF